MRHRWANGRFPVRPRGASTSWRGAKEVSGVALVVAQEVPTSSSMAVPHGPAGVRQARHRMREQLRDHGMPDAVIDDAVLILSELLSNAYRHGRPLGRHAEAGEGDVRAAWRVDGAGGLTVEVTDGGGPTRPVPATPSVTARGGRGLNIISALAQEWGVRDDSPGEVTVWVLVHEGHRNGLRRNDGRGNAPGPGNGLGHGNEARGSDGRARSSGGHGSPGAPRLSGMRRATGVPGPAALDRLGFTKPLDNAG
ncbi:ATP-binding protein [Streptomyces sp. NPDC052042]|uniref:ATP-binding protein n=1 Tax=Streptomyces sp. NPDC052042 TaxID=3365683 RepID=UPI0037D3D1FD